MIELTKNQKTDFYQVGFFILPHIFQADEINEIKVSFQSLQAVAFDLAYKQRKNLDSVKEKVIMHQGSQFVLGQVKQGPSAGQLTIRRVSWCGAAELTLSEYGKDPRLLSIASQLLGSKEMQQLINQAHFKLPGDEVTFEWHQDSTHRGFGSKYWKDVNSQGSYVQTLTAIDDITMDNGPICFIPNTVEFGHLDLSNKLDKHLQSGLFRLQDAVPVAMKSGSVAVFHPYSVHGSQANRSAEPRRTFINGYAYPGANSRQYVGEGAGRIVVDTKIL